MYFDKIKNKKEIHLAQQKCWKETD